MNTACHHVWQVSHYVDFAHHFWRCWACRERRDMTLWSTGWHRVTTPGARYNLTPTPHQVVLADVIDFSFVIRGNLKETTP